MLVLVSLLSGRVVVPIGVSLVSWSFLSNIVFSLRTLTDVCTGSLPKAGEMMGCLLRSLGVLLVVPTRPFLVSSIVVVIVGIGTLTVPACTRRNAGVYHGGCEAGAHVPQL